MRNPRSAKFDDWNWPDRDKLDLKGVVWGLNSELARLNPQPHFPQKTLAREKLTFRAGFSSGIFRPVFGTEMAGKLQSVRRKSVPIISF